MIKCIKYIEKYGVERAFSLAEVMEISAMPVPRFFIEIEQRITF